MPREKPPFPWRPVAASILIYFALYLLLLKYSGRGMSICAIIPVSAFAWHFGLRGGLLAGAASIPLNLLMSAALGLGGWERFFVQGGGLPGSVGLILIGAVLGRMSDLTLQLKRHENELNRLVDEKTENLSQLNQQLRAREQELRATNEQLRAHEHQLRAANQQLTESEKAATKAKDFLENIYETIADGILITDDRGYITRGNQAMEIMLGYSEDELLKMHNTKLTCSADPSWQVGSDIDKLLFEKGFIKNREMQMCKKDGTPCTVEISITLLKKGGRAFGTVGIVRDITERKRIEQSLVHLSTAIRQADECIMITDFMGNIEYANPAAEKISGYAQSEIINQHISLLTSGRHDDAFFEQMMGTLIAGDVWRGHLINRKKDGSFYDNEATISPIRNSSGNITKFVYITRDVTREMRMKEQLRQAQKMEAIGTLAGGIAHDFNNILTAIIGYTQMNLYSAGDGRNVEHNSEQVLSAANRAKDLVRQILTFSRRTEHEKTPVRLGSLINEVVKLLRASIPTTIEIRSDLQTDATILADPTQIHQVLMNLCTNASHAMRERGGKLKIALEEATLDRLSAAWDPDLVPGRYLKLSVSDTGRGIAPELLDRIFDPFFTTKEAGQGTGMGLAVVHGIVKTHGGGIQARSTLGSGSTFSIFLPSRPTPLEPAAPSDRSFSSGSGRILFVDDEEILAELGREILTTLGYTVSIFTSSARALEEFRKSPDRYDLVITDYTMPGINGFELAKQLISIRPDIPIVLCTGFNEMISAEKAKSVGIKDFYTKPIDIKLLSEVVRKVLDSPPNETQ